MLGNNMMVRLWHGSGHAAIIHLSVDQWFQSSIHLLDGDIWLIEKMVAKYDRMCYGWFGAAVTR